MIALSVRPTFLSEPSSDLTVIRTLCDAADMLREGSGERALLLVWTEILDLTNYVDGPAIRALGAVSLGSRALSGMCWGITGTGAETAGGDGELVPLFERAASMREVYEDYLEKEEEAMEAWELHEMEHEIWAARFAEANMFRDTWTPPSIWSDDD